MECSCLSAKATSLGGEKTPFQIFPARENEKRPDPDIELRCSAAAYDRYDCKKGAYSPVVLNAAYHEQQPIIGTFYSRANNSDFISH
ncbi:hypothetical protein TNCV_300541 [Trichonephila clavipes]|nr:hypothetical protein TNCV_300541 [Trichonephila clavipes]